MCVGANVGAHCVPSVLPQSEISLVANNSKTRKLPKGGETVEVQIYTSVSPKKRSMCYITVDVIMLALS